MLNFIAFFFALTLLVSVHEWGHYRVAVALGVKVLRFSVGLGQPVWRWRRSDSAHTQSTEWTIGWLPLGGFVMMLDEAHGPVSPEQLPQAFNRQPLWARALIVVAGPFANGMLAIFLLALAACWGQYEPAAILPTPVVQSPAEKAGLRGGEHVVAAGLAWVDGQAPLPLQAVASFADLLPQALQALRQGRDWEMDIQDHQAPGTEPRRVRLSTADLPAMGRDAQDAAWLLWGLSGPQTPATVINIERGSPADVSGLLPDDRVLTVNGQKVSDAQFLRQFIRLSIASGAVMPLTIEVSRHNRLLELHVQPQKVQQDGKDTGRIGAVIGASPNLVWVEHGVLDSVVIGARKAFFLTGLTLRMVGGLFTGQEGLEQLGGPLSIADQAAKSAQKGLAAYLGFLGFLSISLAVLNLLPLPVLDGGHLMYYLWELLTGKPVSSDGVNVLQKLGLMLLVAVMAMALVNDGIRLMR